MNLLSLWSRASSSWPVRFGAWYMRIMTMATFWLFHATWIIIAVAGVLPYVAWPLFQDLFNGRATWEICWPLLLWMFVPLVFAVIAYVRFRARAPSLFAFLFGVELPLFWGLLLRMSTHELHGAAGLMVWGVVLGIAAATIGAALGDNAPRWLHIPLVWLAGCGILIASFTALITLPVVLSLAYDLIEDLVFVRDWSGAGLMEASAQMILAAPFMLLGTALFIGIPLLLTLTLALPFLAPAAWMYLMVGSARRWRSSAGWSVVLGATTAAMGAFIVVAEDGWGEQEHEQALALAVEPRSEAQARRWLDDEEALRNGLTHAYLATYRTVDQDAHADSLAEGWAEWQRRVQIGLRVPLNNSYELMSDADGDEVRATRTTWGKRIAAVAGPFVHHGHYADDAALAARTYADAYGEQIERSEREALQHALGTTVMRGPRYAGYMDEGAQRVHLLSQEVSITSEGGIATVEIHDEWMNLTHEEQEVLLGFALPPSAAVDGLWLGGNNNKDQAFVGRLAPRGAAQQVYREQVQRRADPALLEQVGPLQYRLRVFPIPASASDVLETDWLNRPSTPHVHTWVRYRVPVAADGVVRTPQLLERRNGFWSEHTKRVIHHGDATAPHDVAVESTEDETWVQGALPKQSTGPIIAEAADRCWQLVPVSSSSSPSLSSLSGRRIDVVVDASYGMGKHRPVLMRALAELEASGAQLRVHLGTNAFLNGAMRIVERPAVDAATFVGAASVKDLLEQYTALSNASSTPGGTRDVILVLAAQGSFDLANDNALAALPVPTYVMHIGGQLPAGYDDATADALSMSGGTVVGSLQEFAAAVKGGSVVVDGWELQPASSCTGASSITSASLPVIARMWIRQADKTRVRSDASTLDALHAVAMVGHVVTPYSSLIALVDAEQLKRLADLAGQQDRFEREVESFNKVPNGNNDLNLTGAPEPTTWALVVAASAAIAAKRRRRKETHAS
jgi:hypothetical protein